MVRVTVQITYKYLIYFFSSLFIYFTLPDSQSSTFLFSNPYLPSVPHLFFFTQFQQRRNKDDSQNDFISEGTYLYSFVQIPPSSLPPHFRYRRRRLSTLWFHRITPYVRLSFRGTDRTRQNPSRPPKSV